MCSMLKRMITDAEDKFNKSGGEEWMQEENRLRYVEAKGYYRKFRKENKANTEIAR